MAWLFVFLGGGVGSVCRYGVGKLVPPTGSGFPAGTLTVNLVGCVIVGLLARYGVNAQPESLQRAALVVGFCGGFTTFSAFSLETVTLMGAGRWGMAALYVATSLIGCLMGTMVATRLSP